MAKGVRALAGLAALLILILFATGFYLISQTMRKHFLPTDEVFGNPLIGYAPSSSSSKALREEVQLAYVEIKWSELEPEEGEFDWEGLEKSKHLSQLRERGSHLVLRLVCDVPGEESHMDIPRWLYKKTGKDGKKYDISYGKGYSPDYANEELIAAHEKAVRALGEYFGDDGFVSYVELGVLGHWGEWHVRYSDGLSRMPEKDVRMRYVRPWLQAFPNAQILLRRPFAEAKENGLGIYNDMTGDAPATLEWLDWIENGGYYDQTGETDAVVPMPDSWKTAAIGGEFTSSHSMTTMLIRDIDQTVRLVKSSHMSFIGPKIADKEKEDGYWAVLGAVGYRFAVSEMQVFSLFGTSRVTISIENDGEAPMYWDWPVVLYVQDENGEEQYPVEAKLSGLLPGMSMEVHAKIPDGKLTNKLKNGNCTLSLGIVDPMTGLPCVRLANQIEYREGKNLLVGE